MLLNTVILIIIGSVGGSPKATAVATFSTMAACQSAGQDFMAAAKARQVLATGVCIQTPFVFAKDRES